MLQCLIWVLKAVCSEDYLFVPVLRTNFCADQKKTFCRDIHGNHITDIIFLEMCLKQLQIRHFFQLKSIDIFLISAQKHMLCTH